MNKRMIIFGVNPNIDGAIIAVNELGIIKNSILMPVLETPKGKIISCFSIRKFIEDNLEENVYSYATIEKANIIPKNGLLSEFNFGRLYGNIEAIFQTLNINISYVPLQTWKTAYGFNGKNNDIPRLELQKLFPDWIDLHDPKKGRALANAYYISKYTL